MSAGIIVVWVGHRPVPPWEALAADYARRIARHVAFTEVRLRPSTGRDRAADRALAHEGEAILSRVQRGDTLVALDEHGPGRTSADFAAWLARQREGARTVVFAVGSDLGLADEVKVRAQERLSLSPMTLPHVLARVVLLEQIYRSLDLLAGGRYHRGESGVSRV